MTEEEPRVLLNVCTYIIYIMFTRITEYAHTHTHTRHKYIILSYDNVNLVVQVMVRFKPLKRV